MNSLKQSIQFIIRIVSRWDPWVLFDKSLYTIGLNQTEVHILILSLVILFLVDLVRYLKGVTIDIFLSEADVYITLPHGGTGTDDIFSELLLRVIHVPVVQLDAASFFQTVV